MSVRYCAVDVPFLHLAEVFNRMYDEKLGLLKDMV